MKESVLKKIYNHVDRDEIISKLTLGISPVDINTWLSEKYTEVGDKSLIFTAKTLKQFKDEELNFYKQMQNDFAMAKQKQDDVVKDMQHSIQKNSAYRAKLIEYAEKELDIKMMVKNMILACEARASEVFDKIQDNPSGAKLDYVLIQWFNTLTIMLEKYDVIINGSPDKIIQQNNINIQILDQHIHVFHNVIREVISRLDYETSLLFVDILNQELKKLKASSESLIPVDIRLAETKQMEQKLSSQLDVPSF